MNPVVGVAFALLAPSRGQMAGDGEVESVLSAAVYPKKQASQILFFGP